MTNRRAGIERMLRDLFERSIGVGELASQVNAKELALFYSVVIQGMALQAQHGGTKEQLESVANVALAAWPQSC